MPARFPDHKMPAQSGIFFHHEVEIPGKLDFTKVGSWIHSVLEHHQKTPGRIEYHFLGDEDLLEINRTHLDHDYYTDIITFPYNDEPVESEIFISVDRVHENAIALGQSFERELLRVIVHGALHLCGYSDSNDHEEATMRQEEDTWLGRW